MLHRTDLSETKYVIGLPSLQLDVQCTYGERLHPKDLKMTSAYKRAESTASSSVIIKKNEVIYSQVVTYFRNTVKM